MNTRITVVIEYDDERDVPPIGVDTLAFIGGAKAGTVVAVAFEDALSEKEESCPSRTE